MGRARRLVYNVRQAARRVGRAVRRTVGRLFNR